MLMCRHVLILHVAQGEYFIVQMLCLHFRGIEPSRCGYFPSFLSPHSYFGEQSSKLTVLLCKGCVGVWCRHIAVPDVCVELETGTGITELWATA